MCNAFGYDFTGMHAQENKSGLLIYLSFSMHGRHIFLVYYADMLVNHTVPQSLSKPVHLHNIVCSSRDLALLECSFTRYSGNTNDIQDVIINCQERKYIMHSTVTCIVYGLP